MVWCPAMSLLLSSLRYCSLPPGGLNDVLASLLRCLNVFYIGTTVYDLSEKLLDTQEDNSMMHLVLVPSCQGFKVGYTLCEFINLKLRSNKLGYNMNDEMHHEKVNRSLCRT